VVGGLLVFWCAGLLYFSGASLVLLVFSWFFSLLFLFMLFSGCLCGVLLVVGLFLNLLILSVCVWVLTLLGCFARQTPPLPLIWSLWA